MHRSSRPCAIETPAAPPDDAYSASPIYTWQGEIHAESEWQLVIKTDMAKFERLKTKVQELHSYEVPEIIAIPIIGGSDAYLNWLEKSLSLQSRL